MYKVSANGKVKKFFDYTNATKFANELRKSGVKPEITGGLFSETPDATLNETISAATVLGYARVSNFFKAIPNLRIIIKSK